MHRKFVLYVSSCFLAVLMFELIVHWLLASNLVPAITTMYLSEDKRNSITTLIDNFLPAIILGIATGWFAVESSRPRIVIAVIVLSFCVVASESLYRLLFSPGQLWWWPPSGGDIVFRLTTTLVLLGLFTSAGLKGRRAKQSRGHYSL